jgi:hypothetical protein
MAVSEPIDNAALLAFVDESVRVLGDRAAGVFSFISQFLDAAKGKGFATLLGTTDEELFRDQPWELKDFASTFVTQPQPIVGSGNGGRTTLTNLDVIAMVRLAQWLQTSRNMDPTIGPQVAKVAVNPRV